MSSESQPDLQPDSTDPPTASEPPRTTETSSNPTNPAIFTSPSGDPIIFYIQPNEDVAFSLKAVQQLIINYGGIVTSDENAANIIIVDQFKPKRMESFPKQSVVSSDFIFACVAKQKLLGTSRFDAKDKISPHISWQRLLYTPEEEAMMVQRIKAGFLRNQSEASIARGIWKRLDSGSSRTFFAVRAKMRTLVEQHGLLRFRRLPVENAEELFESGPNSGTDSGSDLDLGTEDSGKAATNLRDDRRYSKAEIQLMLSVHHELFGTDGVTEAQICREIVQALQERLGKTRGFFAVRFKLRKLLEEEREGRLEFPLDATEAEIGIDGTGQAEAAEAEGEAEGEAEAEAEAGRERDGGDAETSPKSPASALAALNGRGAEQENETEATETTETTETKPEPGVVFEYGTPKTPRKITERATREGSEHSAGTSEATETTESSEPPTTPKGGWIIPNFVSRIFKSRREGTDIIGGSPPERRRKSVSPELGDSEGPSENQENQENRKTSSDKGDLTLLPSPPDIELPTEEYTAQMTRYVLIIAEAFGVRQLEARVAVESLIGLPDVAFKELLYEVLLSDFATEAGSTNEDDGEPKKVRERLTATFPNLAGLWTEEDDRHLRQSVRMRGSRRQMMQTTLRERHGVDSFEGRLRYIRSDNYHVK